MGRFSWAAALLLGSGTVATGAVRPPVIAAYYAASGDAAKAAAIPAERLTHVLYAFAPVCADGGGGGAAECDGLEPGSVTLPRAEDRRRELAALRALKRRNPRLRLLLSVGGWTMSAYPGIVASPARRRVFVRSLAALMRAEPAFDGVDVDWEFPGGGDEKRAVLAGPALARERSDFGALLAELRGALDRVRPLMLTAAVTGYDRAVAAIDWRAAAPRLDHVFVMAYDFTPEREFRRRGDFSGGGGLPGHHANLRATGPADEFGADAMVDRLLAAGVPAGKLVLGVGFYAREWTGALWAPGGFPGRGEAGAFKGAVPWRDLDLPGRARRGQRIGRDERAGATFLHAPDGTFASFEDRWAICAKGRYAAARGLGGLFAWEVGQDDGRLSAALAQAASRRC